jgi:hypothetical protein
VGEPHHRLEVAPPPWGIPSAGRGGCKYTAFVAEGCLRKYTIDASGKEHIVTFAPETWWVADGISLTTGTPSQFFIDAIEGSDLDMPRHAAGQFRGRRPHAMAALLAR